MSRRSFTGYSTRMIEEPVVNLTPLIDVVFVILIAFIVIAPLLELDRVELADAAKDLLNKSVSVQESGPIVIHVKQDNQVSLNAKPITMEHLLPALKKLKDTYPLARPQLFHDKNARFGTYQTIKNIMEMAGFSQMDVILKP